MALDRQNILRSISELKLRLKEIDSERENLINDLSRLRLALTDLENSLLNPSLQAFSINPQPPLHGRIALFRSLFRGREDVYPKLWMSKKTGAKGYSPVCENEWIKGVCEKPFIRCGECDNRHFSPLTDDVISRHLEGNITIGTYPML
ncbi:MAG: restriction endonuclease subunit R, partial [Nitrospirota bacterium]